MEQFINAERDFTPFSAHLQEKGWVQIPNFFNSEFAESMYQCLKNEVPWDKAYFDGKQGQFLRSENLTKNQDLLNSIRDKALNAGKDEYQFLYDSFMLVRAYFEKRHMHLLVHQFLLIINSPEFLGIAKQITQISNLVKMDSQATRYTAGDFLRVHSDIDTTTSRRVAYVANFSKNWSVDWGGLLHFVKQGEITKTIVPEFNTLNLFLVPQEHFVSQVSSFAQEPRLSMTGWMFDKL